MMSILYKNAIDKIVSASFTGDDGLDYVETLVALDALKSMERTHGEWIFIHPLQMDGPVGYMCSNCKTGNFDVNPETWKACPWCGADMREGDLE